MLREVIKSFDIDSNVTVKAGDIVDVSGWRNRAALEDGKYIIATDATKATVDPDKVTKAKKKASSAPKSPVRTRKRSALASRPRVFQRQA